MILQSNILRAAMHIAVVTETYLPEINGVAITMRHMVDVLRRRHHITLIRPRQTPQDRAAQAERYAEVLVPAINLPRYDFLKLGLPATAKLKRLWRAQRPDIVHVVTEGPLGWSAVKAAGALGLPCTSDFHTNFHTYSKHYGAAWLEAPVMAWLRRLHNRTLATYVPTAALQAELAAAGYRGLRVVSRGVDTRQFDPARRSAALRESWGIAPGELAVISVGRLAREKGLPETVRVFRALRNHGVAAKLVIVGDGPERATLEKLAPEAYFAGMRIDDDLGAHYASADLFLFNSMSETYGNVTVEAMASGLPVVAYDYGAAAERIVHGVNGLVAPVEDEAKFTALALQLAQDAGLRARLGREARASAERRNWDHVDPEFEDALFDACRGRPESGAQPAVAATR